MLNEYEARAAEHAPKLTTEERAAVAAIREYLKLKLRGASQRYALDVFVAGIVNANDTVFVEHAQPRAEWLSMAVGSMAGLLADGYRHRDSAVTERQFARVVAAFHAINIRG